MELEGLIRRLRESDVEFVLVGGVAAAVHGSARLTSDLDIVYDRSRSNVERLVAALADQDPYLRGAPPGLPFEWSVETVLAGLNLTLTTALGSLDIFGEIPGGGSYPNLVPHSVTVDLFGNPVRCLSLDKLLETKRAAGRPRDLEAIAELEAIREERGDTST